MNPERGRQLEFKVPLTRREAVANQLRSEIFSGTLAPGAPIRDAELAARLDVSITPVREAVTQLISEGLIQATANKRRHVSTLTQREAIELMDMLGIILVAALQRAASNFSPTGIDSLQFHVDSFVRKLSESDLEEAGKSLTSVVDIILEVANHGELSAVAKTVVPRSLQRIRLYPSQHLYPLWMDAFTRMAELLKSGQSHAAVMQLSAFFVDLVERMRAERTTEAVVDPRYPPKPSLDSSS